LFQLDLITYQFVCYVLFVSTVCSSGYTTSNDRIMVSSWATRVLGETSVTWVCVLSRP
jgi:hypothetical protein